MSILLAINLIILFLSLAIFFSLTREYKILYSLGFGVSLIILIAFSLFKYGVAKLTFTDAAMILYRGGLILAFAGGALSCFVATKLANKN